MKSYYISPIGQETLYFWNQACIYEYWDGVEGHGKKYKITWLRALRNRVTKIAEDFNLPGDVVDKDGKICMIDPEGNLCKLGKNLARARDAIFQLAYCNQWDFFFTGTIDGNKHDRSDLDMYRKKLTHMIRNYNNQNGQHVKYLFVPELHADRQNWHVHGFLRGLPVSELHRFVIGDQMSEYISRKVYAGKNVYHWKRYTNAFGWCDLEPIESREGACNYVTKYISKALDKSVSKIYKDMYYHSQGLKTRKKLLQVECSDDLQRYIFNNPNTYRGEYTASLWLDNLDDVSEMLFQISDTRSGAHTDGP